MIPYPFVTVVAGSELTAEGIRIPTVKQVRYDSFVLGLFKPQNPELMKLHCGIGLAGEAGELADAIKKEVIYGKPADRDNIIEELGDIMFYAQATMNMYNITPEEVFQGNADKLGKRYAGLHYSDEQAINRADKNAG